MVLANREDRSISEPQVVRRGRIQAPASVPRAVVVGLDHVNGLQTARILTERGVPVIGVVHDRSQVCARTRLPERIVEMDTASETLIDGLVRLGRHLGTRAVLFPALDQQVHLISSHRERLEPWFHVVLPDHDVVDLLMDKVRFYTWAMEHDLPLPRTAFLRTRGDAANVAATSPFPLVLKPPTSGSPAWERNVPLKAFIVTEGAELLDVYDRYGRFADLLIAQELIPGPTTALYSCNAYFDSHGEPASTFVARKIRQWPPETGESCLGEECRNDEVLDITMRLFRQLDFRGLAYLEVKRDERTGRHVIVEPNVGRPTGRSPIAEAGGVDLHLAMYRDALGLEPPPNLRQRYGGARWIFLRRDLQSAAHEVRAGHLTVGGYLRSMRGRTREALFTWRDPGPFVWDWMRCVRLAVVRSVGRAGRGVSWRQAGFLQRKRFSSARRP